MAAVLTDPATEWTAAREVQERFMQRCQPKVDILDYSARCRQMQELGGDFYDFLPLPDGRVALAVGDASGKGLAAALMMSNVQSSLRTAVFFAGGDGVATLYAVNRQVYEASCPDRYATLFYGVFDRTTRTLRYVNAGHQPPMVLRADGSTVWLESGGAPAGMFPAWAYEEGTVRLDPGDVVIAYTDGVTEAENPDGEEWGVEGLRNAAYASGARCADEMVDAILTRLDEFSGGYQTDDVTLVALHVH